MGYFNIFYKLTRIIDFFTRKRNRKFVLALCLIGGIVFFSPNVANAQYSSFDSQQLVAIRNDLDSINNGVDVHLSVLYTSLLNQEYDIDAIRTYVTSILSTLGTMNSNLTTVKNTLNTIETDVDDLETQINDLLTYANSIEIKIDTIMNTLNNIDYNIEHYGELNHADLLDIQETLREYLYGDEEQFALSFSQISNFVASGTGVFITNSGYNTIYFKIKEGYNYNVYFSKLTENTPQAHEIRFGFCSKVPSVGDSFMTYNDWSTISYANEIGFNADSDKYFYLSYSPYIVGNFYVSSNYNEGQQVGIYGGLTNIESTTINQGEQTRTTIETQSQAMQNTITDTNIPTSEMNIDTSIVDGVSNEENDNFLISIINKFQSVISPSSSVTTITIPIPKTGKNIVLRSDLLSSHISNTIIGTYITVFWYVVFFIYFFKFAYRVINWVVTGEIIEKPSGFMKYLMDQNAIITASMM